MRSFCNPEVYCPELFLASIENWSWFFRLDLLFCFRPDVTCGIERYMTDYFLNVPSQKFPVPKITKQTKSHSLNFNVLSSVIDSSGEEV